MVIEVVIFRPFPDVDIEIFQQAIDASMAFFQSQKGFISRKIGKAEGGLLHSMHAEGWNEWWLDVMHWETMEDAQNASAAFLEHPTGQRLMGLADTRQTQAYFL